ncbi:small ribosomal subunit protein mS25-like [Liolophura sinensis]|uniref:small ribosomal subunit protein mS25-like n=1 Tax=Liolophura sinensis TaxID=3198878 RepID=UPI003158B443
MPFMKGKAPIRRTLNYLEKGRIVFKPKVKILAINYNTNHPPSKGTQQFVFWHLPQVQYKNPSVQCVTFKNMTPSPFIQVFLDGDEKVLVDTDSRSKDEILEHVNLIFGKTEKTLRDEAIAQEKKDNPANFGPTAARECMCEITGQVPCPAFKPLPRHMRGKYQTKLKEEGMDAVYEDVKQ